MRGRTSKAALIGWRAMQYVEIAFDEHAPLTALTGPSGAGKSTLAMCLDYALLPDRKMLDIRPITDLQDPHRAGIDPLGSRIDPALGYAYVALELFDRRGERVVLGIHVSLEDGRGRITRWQIRNPGDKETLQDLMRVVDGDNESYPDYLDLQRSLATRGFDLVECRTVAEYADVMYEAGVLPSNLADLTDRALYARLLESAFRGGLSHEVAGRLRDYLLPEQRKIPDSVARLQECTQQVLRTRGALEQADRDLRRLQATYGTGREVVLRAVGLVVASERQASADIAASEKAIGAARTAISAGESEVRRLGELEQVAKAAKERIDAERKRDVEALLQSQASAKGAFDMCREARKTAEGKLSAFHTGQRVWRAAVAGLPATAIDAAKDQINALRDDEKAKERKCREEASERARRIAQLEESAATASSNELADLLGVSTIADAFDTVEPEDALRAELALGGLVEGVVGAGIEDLARLPDSPNLPDTFWLLTGEPDATEPHRVGPWNVVPAAGGYLVASDRRRLTLGAKNRQRRIEELGREREQLSQQASRHAGVAAEWKNRYDALVRDEERVAVFLANPDGQQGLETAVAVAKEAEGKASFALEDVAKAILRLHEAYDAKLEPIRDEIARIPAARASAQRSIQEAIDIVLREEKRASGARQARDDAKRILKGAALVFGASWDAFLSSAEAFVDVPHDRALIDQAAALESLARALEAEPPERLASFRTAAADNPESCVLIWPVLREIVAESVSGELLDAVDGEDLIQSMRDSRSVLAAQLTQHETDLQSEAKYLHQVIVQEVRRQTNRINHLSRSGEGLAFGNVHGVRVRCTRKTELLAKLEQIAPQLNLFARRADQPVGEVLREVFEAQLKVRFDDKALLDYRSYMDLTLEARRAQGSWEPASSLSGGESIGCGLAVALMLARSLASRGESRPEEFVPLFIVDEAQRLDPAGQGVIVDLARREHFQVLITAIDIQPEFDCTVYAVGRQFSPREMVHTRRLRVRQPQPRQ